MQGSRCLEAGRPTGTTATASPSTSASMLRCSHLERAAGRRHAAGAASEMALQRIAPHPGGGCAGDRLLGLQRRPRAAVTHRGAPERQACDRGPAAGARPRPRRPRQPRPARPADAHAEGRRGARRATHVGRPHPERAPPGHRRHAAGRLVGGAHRARRNERAVRTHRQGWARRFPAPLLARGKPALLGNGPDATLRCPCVIRSSGAGFLGPVI